MIRYLSADINCSETQTAFRERSARKTVSFEEKVMSKAKYASIFSPQIEAVYNSSNLFRITRGFEN